MQSYLAGFAASGALTSLLRMLTKLAFEKSHNGLRKGASMLIILILQCSYIFSYTFIFSWLTAYVRILCPVKVNLYLSSIKIMTFCQFSISTNNGSYSFGIWFLWNNRIALSYMCSTILCNLHFHWVPLYLLVFNLLHQKPLYP